MCTAVLLLSSSLRFSPSACACAAVLTSLWHAVPAKLRKASHTYRWGEMPAEQLENDVGDASRDVRV